VRKYLSQKYVVQEEDLLERIADSSEKGESVSSWLTLGACLARIMSVF